MTPTPSTAHVAVASLNQTVGDWTGNRDRIVAACERARARGATLLALPEMCISGYSLGDRVLMDGTVERSWEALREILPATKELIVTLGLPIRHEGVLYNVMVVVADGRPVGVVPKENLAVGDVEYENRWYSGWTRGQVETWSTPDGPTLPMGTLVFDAPGLGRFGLEVCEDGWKGVRPGAILALAGARILINSSASWFVLGKHRIRRDLVTSISREDRVAYLYSSLLGCDATRLVFDGSVFVAANGEVKAEGRRFLFEERMELVDVVLDLGALSQERISGGSWRQQVHAMKRGEFGRGPAVVTLNGWFGADDPTPAPSPYWEVPPVAHPDPSLAWLHEAGLLSRAPTAQDLPHLELELTLALGLHEYLTKAGIPGVALALSGGRDSAMCALLVHRALRYANAGLDEEALRALVRKTFVTAYLATGNSSDATEGAARELAAELGTEHLRGDIQPTVDLHLKVLSAMTGVNISWDEPAHDIPLQNVQARLRSSLIWFVANLKRRLLLTTSNKSEAAVGYTTMDGDSSGGLAPIADVPKSLVTSWLRWAAGFHGYQSIHAVLGTPATAELRPAEEAQTDEDDLMPFAVLDRLMFHFVQLGQEPVTIFKRLWPELQGRYGGDPKAFAAHIRKFVRMFCGAQWKRERFAISFRVTVFDLDPKGGFRFPPIQAPFTEELADLDAYVASIT